MDPRPSQGPIVRNEQIKTVPRAELTEQEKRIAELLENSPLEARDKIFLLLVWRNLKSASALSVRTRSSHDDSDDLKERVKRAGLFFKKGKVIKEFMHGLQPGRICFVANNKEDLELISRLWYGNHDQDPEVYRELGRMSGYPQTAIDAFGELTRSSQADNESKRKELFLTEEEKEKMIPPELFYFSLLFLMSRENWRTELETIRKWVEEIKLVAPDLCKKFRDSFYSI